MLTPEQYTALPKQLEGLAQDLEAYILRDICRRLRGAEVITPTAEIQMAAMIEQGKSAAEIQSAIQRMLRLTEAATQALFEQAAEISTRFDADVYKQLGKDPIKLQDNSYLQSVIHAQAEQTGGELRNFTRSLGFSVVRNGRRSFLPAAQAYQYSLDMAQVQILSGGVDPRTAICNAVRTLTDSGLRTVDYAAGRTEQIDVAMRRATVTGLSQVTGKIMEVQAQGLDTDLVEVSAHGGARDTGSGLENHKQWQGKVYSLSGTNKKYPSLKAKTGYGHVAGLKGANCRHDFHPFVEGVSQRQYTDEELENIDPPPITYEGRTYTKYEATQMQRRLEAAMRKAKRECLAFDALGDGESYGSAAVRLKRLQTYYGDFSKAAGLRQQGERAQVMEFGRAAARKSGAVAVETMRKDAERREYLAVKPEQPKVAKAPDYIIRESVEVDAGFVSGAVPKGALAEKVRVIAGYGTSAEIRVAKDLAKEYGGDYWKWEKKGGIITTDNFQYDVHWYEYDGKQYRAKLKGVKPR